MRIFASRDDALVQLHEGRVRPDQAEEWLRQTGQPPFRVEPETTLFDPMAEEDWTPAMVAAWAIWRASWPVRQYSAAYVRACTILRPQEDGGLGYDLVTPLAPGADDLDPTRLRVELPSRVDPRLVVAALREALQTGLQATGQQSPNGERVLIPDPEWKYLTRFGDEGAFHDCAFRAQDEFPSWYRIRIKRDDARKWWEPVSGANAPVVIEADVEAEVDGKPEVLPPGKAGRDERSQRVVVRRAFVREHMEVLQQRKGRATLLDVVNAEMTRLGWEEIEPKTLGRDLNACRS